MINSASSAGGQKNLTNINSVGGQNETRYAFSAIRRVGGVRRQQSPTDTGDHRISGVQQHQSGSAKVTFTSQHGEVDLATLKPA
jgi:hypothetical protein